MTAQLASTVAAVQTLIREGVPPSQAAEVVARVATTDLPPVMTFREAVAFLRVPEASLRAEIGAGNLKAKRVSNKVVIIRRHSVLMWLGEEKA